MTNYVHVFLESPVPTVIMVNDVQFSYAQVQKLSLPFSPKFVVTENQDPPFSKVQQEANRRYVYVGCKPGEEFAAMLGMNTESVPHVIVTTDERMPPTINSELAFLAALDIAVEQHGEAMPVELKTLLHSFISTEKRNKGISE
ncbi:MAG: hypothetical protein Q7S02_01240 [bacterium]|nr:hypothetical protein [bacterium]